MRRAIEVAFFVRTRSWMTGTPLNPKSCGESGHCLCAILVVYIGHGILHPALAVLFFSPNQVFGRDLNLRS